MAKVKDERPAFAEKTVAVVSQPADVPAQAADVSEPPQAGNENVSGAGSGRVKAYWATKFPDKSYKDDDEFDGLLADWLEEQDENMARHATAEETFRRVASEHPELLDMVEDLANDPEMPVWEALYRNTDGEFDFEEGTPDFDRMRKARKDRLSKASEAEALRKKLEENFENSRKVVADYFAEKGMSEEEQKALGEYIDGHLGQYLENVITPELLDTFNRARTYQKDVDEAREVGAIRAKNERIDAERQRRAAETDGLPAAGSSAGVMAEEQPASKDFLDEILDKTEKRRNWMDR